MHKQLEHFGEQLLVKVRQLWRQRKNLLVVRMLPDSLRIDYWRKGEQLWSEEAALKSDKLLLTSDTAAYLAAAEEALRAVLLAKDIEENVYTLLLPADFMLQDEQLVLPLLSSWELRQAVSWEAANAFPWEAGSFTYAYLVEKEQQEEECLLYLWGLPLKLLEEMKIMAEKLLVNLQVVMTNKPDAVAKDWYNGKRLARFERQKQALLREPRLQRLLARAAGAILLVSLACYAGAWAGCYLAQEEVREVQGELARYKVWQERKQASELVAQKISHLEKQLARKKQSTSRSASGELERLSRQLAQVKGCWLTQVKQQKTGSEVQGKAINLQVVQLFVDRLEATGSYKKVELRQTQAQADAVEYSLYLQVQEAKL